MDEKLDKYIDACVEYYYKDNNIMTDWEYDQLAIELDKNYDKLPQWFKDYVDKENFRSGGYAVGWKFGRGEWVKGGQKQAV